MTVQQSVQERHLNLLQIRSEGKGHDGEMMPRNVSSQAPVRQHVDTRSYSLKKGQLERDYAQALQKLASQYLKRDWPGINPDDQRTDYRSYLEGTVQVSQSRLNVCDNYKGQVSDPAKTLRLYKEQQLKKTMEQLSGIQAELQESVKELAKAKKKYYDCEQVAHAVREKADIEAKSKLGLFQSRISLQKASVKLKAKRSDCNSKATQARNDYLLSLAAANAHHDRYYHTDLLHGIQVLDGGIFEHMKDYLVSLCRTELETFQATHNAYQFLLDKSTRSLEECESHGLPSTEQGRLDLELKIEDTKECIRKAEVCVCVCVCASKSKGKAFDITFLDVFPHANHNCRVHHRRILCPYAYLCSCLDTLTQALLVPSLMV
ncbi:hypothetical protein NHX12_007991 [Muraenolepis orangiensis]|uniref:F-BAR domain-containing protein n=1 Tax=Muraenolepis orangiensis TaxID=630683 RepID=A0A9Q0I8W2_9TELE|nr:hypothetical protein NHX12_007991 [Muraenolepis orangiensis]